MIWFCSSSPILKKSGSEKNPGRLYMTCRYKECDFFQWADIPLIPKNRPLLDQEAFKSLPKKELTSPFHQTMVACLPSSSRNFPKSVSQVSRNELDCDFFEGLHGRRRNVAD